MFHTDIGRIIAARQRGGRADESSGHVRRNPTFEETPADSPKPTIKVNLRDEDIPSPPRPNVIRLSPGAGSTKISPRVMGKLAEFDIDSDGHINKKELASVVRRLMEEETDHESFKSLACVASALLLFVLVANLGMAVGVGFMAKELHVVEGSLFSSRDGTPVHVASSEIRIESGRLLSRGTGNGDHDDTPLETSVATTTEPLDTRHSDEFLSSLESIHLGDDSSGASAVFNVLGFARVPGQPEALTADRVAGPKDALHETTEMRRQRHEATHPENRTAASGSDEIRLLTSGGVLALQPNGSIALDAGLSEFLSGSGFGGGAERSHERRLLFSASDCGVDGRWCGIVNGAFQAKQLATCKYGNARDMYDACYLYCAGFKGKGFQTEICKEDWNMSPYAPRRAPCNNGNDNECENTSRGCAPENGSFCCCYKGGNSNRYGSAPPPSSYSGGGGYASYPTASTYSSSGQTYYGR